MNDSPMPDHLTGTSAEMWTAMGGGNIATRLVHAFFRETGLPIGGDGRHLGALLRKYREEMRDWRNVGEGCLARVDAYLATLPEEEPGPRERLLSMAQASVSYSREALETVLDHVVRDAVDAALKREAEGLRTEADRVADGKSAHTLMWAAARIDPDTEI